MRNIIFYGLLLIGGMLLPIYNSYAGEPVRTVKWYELHDGERQRVVDICNNNPGELELTPNCINAKRANTLPTTKSGVQNDNGLSKFRKSLGLGQSHDSCYYLGGSKECVKVRSFKGEVIKDGGHHL